MCKRDSIRIMVASTQAADRLGLTIIIDSQPDMEVIAQTGSVPEAMQLLFAHLPDLTLIEASLVDDGVAEALARLRRQHPRCRFLVYAMYEAEESVQRALRAGAEGCVLKGTAHCDLLQAIRTVHAGGQYAPVVNPSSPSREGPSVVERGSTNTTVGTRFRAP
ncbi:MAG: response regulator transcription factor [Bryobacteraceae bacterium]|jgi:DNA-binding NarL/FixJ family response regulator